MSFEELLVNYRADNNMSQEKLGKMLGVSMVTIRSWENGNKPRRINEIRIRKILEKGAE